MVSDRSKPSPLDSRTDAERLSACIRWMSATNSTRRSLDPGRFIFSCSTVRDLEYLDRRCPKTNHLSKFKVLALSKPIFVLFGAPVNPRATPSASRTAPFCGPCSASQALRSSARCEKRKPLTLQPRRKRNTCKARLVGPWMVDW